MKRIMVIIFGLFLFTSTSLLMASNKKIKNKKNIEKHTSPKNQNEGSLDLSSEIQESVSDAKKTVKEIRSASKTPKKKTPKQILRVSGSSETVQVPDSVEWEHNRKKQDKQIQNLQKQIDKEPNQPSMGEG